MHAILTTWPTECYSYSYCVGGSYVCWFYAAVCALSLDHDFHEKLGKIAVNLITIFFRGHSSLAKYCTVWEPSVGTVFSIRCLLTGLCNSDSKCPCQHHGHFLANHLNSLIIGRTEFMLQNLPFSQNNHPSSIDLWTPLLLSAKLNAPFMEIL